MTLVGATGQTVRMTGAKIRMMPAVTRPFQTPPGEGVPDPKAQLCQELEDEEGDL